MLFKARQALLRQSQGAAVALSLLVVPFFSLTASAETVPQTIAKPATAAFDAEKLSQIINSKIGLNVEYANLSPFPGLAELVTDQGLFYSSYDGSYLIQGTMFGLAEQTVTNYTEATIAKMRVKGVEKFADDTIVFKAKNEKHVITVFTDITCGYCRKMHEQMDDYNDLGITVRYLAYPRQGIKDRSGQLTQGFQDLRSIWCHEDPQNALTKAKSGSSVADRICSKPVEEEFNFGRQIGVTGTPAIILANGDLRPGYVPPEALFQYLENM